MYRLRTGEFAGMRMEEALLKSGPRLYEVANWARSQAEQKPNLQPLVREFDRLEKLLARVHVQARCEDTKCKRRARWMTFEQAHRGYLTIPYMWCDRHENPDEWGYSEKVGIGFDALKLFHIKEDKRIVWKRIIRAWGIKKGTRINERFAIDFFANLGSSTEHS